MALKPFNTIAGFSVGNTGSITVVDSVGNVSANFLSVTANANLGNYATANFFSGDGGLLTNISATTSNAIANGTSNVRIPAASGNINLSVGGTSNVLVVTTTGVNVAGTINSTGNTTVQGNVITQNILSSNSTGGGITISVPASTTANTIGGGINITGGNGNGTGGGGGVVLTGGAGTGATAVGAGVTLSGGSSNNVGGDIGIYGGPSRTFGQGGGVQVLAGDSPVSSVSGAGLTLGGSSNTVPGNAQLYGAYVYNSSNVAVAGRVNISGGDNYTGNGSGGFVSINGGLGNNGGVEGGSVTLEGGYSISGTTRGGNTNIQGGNSALGTNISGGAVIITGGVGTGSGQPGNILLRTSTTLASGTTVQTTANRVIINDTTVNIVTSTNSTSTTSGGLVVAGGVGISGNLYAGGIVNITGNANIGNLGTTGNITAGYYFGNGSQLTGISATTASSLANGTSNVSIPASGGNVNTSVGGVSNVLVVTTTGANITGTLETSGNTTVSNLIANTNIFTPSITTSATNGNLTIDPNGSGNLVISSTTPVVIANGQDSNSYALLLSGNLAATVNYGLLHIGEASTSPFSYSPLWINKSANTTTWFNFTNPNTGSATSVGFWLEQGTSGSNYLYQQVYPNGLGQLSSAKNLLIDTETSGNITLATAGYGTVVRLLDNGVTEVNGNAYFYNGITANSGNITMSTGVFVGNLANGTSNIRMSSGGNVTTSVGGTSNVLVVTTTGANITGTLNTGTGNANVGNIGATTGVFTTAVTISGANGTVFANNHTASGNATGNANVTTVTGNLGIRTIAATYTDNSAAASATLANAAIHAIATPTLAAANATVTATNAATFFIQGAPTAGTNMTITNPYALYVGAGNSLFTSNVTVGNLIGTVANGTSNINMTSGGNIGMVRSGTTRLLVTNSGVNVTGAFSATSKSFLIQHPINPEMHLQYGSLESPYHGVRLTGEAVVKKGKCVIILPDYIRGLIKQEGAQVQLTNYQHGRTLYVDSINVDENMFIVKSNWKLSELKFFWSFTGIRKDVEDLVVEY